jgi:RsiW-degrading membrane proteinase PrsW (M82 family)
MTHRVKRVRHWMRKQLDSLYQFWQGVLEKYPIIVTVYTIFSWISIFVFLLSFIFLEDSRTVFVQFLWSFYVLLQFWLICRSKTLPWKRYVAFFLAGAWLVAPFTNGVVQLFHLVFGGQTSDLWSTAVLTPIAEEVFKLIPVGVYLFLSRRASSLSLSDYVLIGAATGAGFQFLEETARRLTSGFIGYGQSLFGQVIQWDVFSLFPGYFEESFLPTRMTSSHAVLTALVVLGIGIAVRWRRRLNLFAYAIPVVFLALVTLDHAVWNGQYRFPDWVLSVHDALGNGYAAKPLLLLLIACAVAHDYWVLNRIRQELPLLNGEVRLNPFSELWVLCRAFVKERYTIGYLWAFYRERKELGFTLLYGNDEARENLPSLQESVRKWYIPLIALACVCVITFTLIVWVGTWVTSDPACFACLFDGLQRWWDGLEWYEKGALVLGAFALSYPLLGFWSAVGLATTAVGIAGSGREIADVIRHPDKLRDPEYALAAIVAVGLSRIPGARIVTRKVLPTASGLTRYELTTAAGLTYRVTLGSRGELRSVFAKIEPHHIGRGSNTNQASRDFARSLGKPTDDAGHGIGRNLGGPGGKTSFNIFPQSPHVNRGAFQQFEQQIVRAVQSGKDVFVRVVPKYAPGATRPHEIYYYVRIDGKTVLRVFPNP